MTMTKNKYIGLTIGPIYKTLSMARKTRELWGASYLFSYLMRNIAGSLISNNIKKKDQFIIPYAGDIDTNKYHHGAGLYPDRLIFPADDDDFEKLKETTEQVMKELCEGMAKRLSETEKNVQKDIDQYFQVYFLEKEIEEGENPILKLSPYIDTLELQQKFISEDDNQYLASFLDNVNGSFLFKDGFRDQEKGELIKKRFDSLIEISARGLRKFNESQFDRIIQDHFKNRYSGEEDEDKLIEKLKEIEEIRDNFKTYHKYIAIVQADGDRLGETLKKIGGDKDEIIRFSKKLMEFAGLAARIVAEYGGTPVYVGGDDLLFFAPVANSMSEIDGKEITSIFDLVDYLDKKFKEYFDNASISFGVSISYYKYPLKEALEQARELLFNQAKKYKYRGKKGKEKEKNALAFKILKHSGSTFGATFNKDSGIYCSFMKLLDKYGGEKKHLNSIIHTLQLHQKIFKHIGKNKKQVENFLENSFDEAIHDDYKPFLEAAADLIFTVYSESLPGEDDNIKFARVYAALRTLHFLKRKDND